MLTFGGLLTIDIDNSMFSSPLPQSKLMYSNVLIEFSMLRTYTYLVEITIIKNGIILKYKLSYILVTYCKLWDRIVSHVTDAE